MRRSIAVFYDVLGYLGFYVEPGPLRHLQIGSCTTSWEIREVRTKSLLTLVPTTCDRCFSRPPPRERVAQWGISAKYDTGRGSHYDHGVAGYCTAVLVWEKR